MKLKAIIFLICTSLAAILAGCTAAHRSGGRAPETSRKITLQETVKIAVEKTADTRTLEALQQIAREHIRKNRLLELPDIIYDLPRRLPDFTVENDIRLSSLDHAIESCRILTSQAQSDLNRIQRKVETKKIGMELAVRWAKLDYVRNMKKAGLRSINLDTLQRDTVLELSIASGIPEEMIRNFDYSTLPQPDVIDIPAPPEYISKLLSPYGSAPDAALRFADIVYRLPSELLHRNDSDFHASFLLAETAAGCIKMKIAADYLNSSLQKYRHAQQLQKSVLAEDKEIFAAGENAKLNWRIAYFRLLYDQISYPANPAEKELTFLTDLISLQGK